MSGTLYLVPTPIGNLEDITLRALRILREVDLIACEDTRHTRKLLSHFDIHTPTLSYHEHNERDRVTRLLGDLQNGKSVAIVSDAGMPGISDPGAVIVQAAIEAGCPVTALPGACAFPTALAASGLNTEQFLFAGFLPAKQGARRQALEGLRDLSATLVFYEAPHRLLAFLEDALLILGNRPAVVAREISKQFEEYIRLPLRDQIEHFNQHEPRGEMVILIAGKSQDVQTEPLSPRLTLREDMERLIAGGISPNAAMKQLSQKYGVAKRELYRQWQEEKDQADEVIR